MENNGGLSGPVTIAGGNIDVNIQGFSIGAGSTIEVSESTDTKALILLEKKQRFELAKQLFSNRDFRQEADPGRTAQECIQLANLFYNACINAGIAPIGGHY